MSDSAGARKWTRREAMMLAAAGVSATSLSGWLGPLAAASPRAKKSCVLLWMDGGPSQTDTFDPKPDAPAEIRGELGTVGTSVPGIRIGERFPRLARLMRHGAVIRSMKTVEADHARARLTMHTGYRPGAGGVIYPSLGSTVSAEIGDPESPLPDFVVAGTPLNKHDVLRDPGYRGPRYQPLVLRDLSKGLENSRTPLPPGEFNRRVALLERFDRRFIRRHDTPPARTHEAGIDGALRLLRSKKARAFDLSLEPRASADPYGNHAFGRGCLLARRLVEEEVAFVEVYLSNWDSHEGKVARETRNLMTQVDQGASALLSDLKERGLLDRTLVVWMGEFGRTPRINRNGGRDHYAKAWSTALFGGGVRGGQVVGATDARGAEVTDRPVGEADFMATVCSLLGIDPAKEVTAPNGRPIRIVEEGGKAVTELL